MILTSGAGDNNARGFSISVVMPLYNKEASVADTIGSIFRQSRLPDEIVIVDDGSTDDSVNIARAAIQAGPGIPCQFIEQANAGVSVARNRGAEAAHFPYMAFLDADDEWLPPYLAEVEKLALAFPEASVLTTRNAVRDFAGNCIPEPIRLPSDFFGIVDRPLLRLAKGRGLIHSSSVTIRKDAWERGGGFPPGARQGEDLYLWLKLAMREKIAHSAKPLSIFHLEHSEAQARKALVGYHFAYFLGTAEGRAYLSNPDLKTFLSGHLFRRIVFRRLIGHEEIQPELRRLARALPFRAWLACWLAASVPLPALRFADWLRTRFRGQRVAPPGAAAGNPP